MMCGNEKEIVWSEPISCLIMSKLTVTTNRTESMASYRRFARGVDVRRCAQAVRDGRESEIDLFGQQRHGDHSGGLI